MPGSYSFAIDVNRSFAMIKVAGFFSKEEVRAFRRDRDEAFGRLESAPNQHVTLVDMQGMSIQTQDAVNAFAQVLGAQRYQSRKLAFVVATSLASKQIGRAAAGRGAEFFMSETSARDWLLADDGRCSGTMQTYDAKAKAGMGEEMIKRA